MQHVTISIDSKFSIQLQCPFHPLSGIISVCVDDACNQPLCLLCIAEHCQSHFLKGSQPKLEDASKLFIQCSDELQKAVKQSEELSKKLQSFEEYSKQEKDMLRELERSKQSTIRLVERVFNEKISELRLKSTNVSFNLQRLQSEITQLLTELNCKEKGAFTLQQTLKKSPFQNIFAELEQIRTRVDAKQDFTKNFKVIVEQEAIESKIKETLDVYIKMYQEKAIFDAMNARNTTANVNAHTSTENTQAVTANIQTINLTPAISDANPPPTTNSITSSTTNYNTAKSLPERTSHLARADLDKRLESIKSQLLSNLGESRNRRPITSALSAPTWKDSLSRDGDSTGIMNKSVAKFLSKQKDHNENYEVRGPLIDLNNIEIKKEDMNETITRRDNGSESSSLAYSRSNSYMNPPNNTVAMEEEAPLVTKFPSRLPSTNTTFSFKPSQSEESIEASKMEQEDVGENKSLEAISSETNLPNESSFLPSVKRTCLDTLSQDSGFSVDIRNLENKDFFSIDAISDRESDVHSRTESITNEADALERKLTLERLDVDFDVKTANDVEDENIGLLYYFQWRSKQLHMMKLEQIDQGPQRPRFETYTLDINFLIPDYHGSILLPDKRIFMIGGQSLANQNVKHKETYQLDLSNKTFIRRADMILGRDSHSLCHYNGYIYAIGGVSNEGTGKDQRKVVTERCERYDLQNDRWTEIKALDYPVCNHCCCVFNKKYIFAFGGRTSSTKLTNKIFRYDLSQDTWITLHMKPSDSIGSFVLTSQACCRQINSKHIFVFGGYSEERNISNQSFILEITEEQEAKGRRGFEIKHVNKKRLIFAAPFWEKQPIIYNNKLYSLQNVITHTNPKLSYCTSRRVISFDGKKWASIC